MQIHLIGITLEIKLEVEVTPKEQTEETNAKQKPLDKHQLLTTVHKRQNHNSTYHSKKRRHDVTN